MWYKANKLRNFSIIVLCGFLIFFLTSIFVSATPNTLIIEHHLAQSTVNSTHISKIIVKMDSANNKYPTEYHHTNGTVITTFTDLLNLQIFCGMGTGSIGDICYVWQYFEEYLDSGQDHYLNMTRQLFD